MSDLQLKDLTDTELYEKQNLLSSRLSMLAHSGKSNTMAYNQCYTWFMEINEEMFERSRMSDDDVSGSVIIIGEPETETEEE